MGRVSMKCAGGRDKNERSWMFVLMNFRFRARPGEEYELEVYIPVFG